MKTFLILVLFSLIATSTFAAANSHDEHMGIYFDLDAWQYCANVAPLSHVSAYIIYINPILTQIRGFECKLRYDADDNNTSITPSFPVPGTDVGVKLAPVFNFIVGYGIPVPTSQATVLATLDIFYLDFTVSPMHLFLEPSTPSSSLQGLPMVVRNDFTLMDVYTISNYPIAFINDTGQCVMDSEGASWGEVKSLFR